MFLYRIISLRYVKWASDFAGIIWQVWTTEHKIPSTSVKIINPNGEHTLRGYQACSSLSFHHQCILGDGGSVIFVHYCSMLYNVSISSLFCNTKYIYLDCTMCNDSWKALGWLFRQIILLRNVIPLYVVLEWKYELCILCLYDRFFWSVLLHLRQGN